MKLTCAILMTTLSAWSADLRIGIIGLDTSHVIAFTQLLNDSSHKQHVPGGKVVAAFKGGSRDIESSWSRVEGYTQQLEKTFGVKIVSSIEELCREVDVVLLESVDGRPHLEQVKPVFAAGKKVFIDKPLAGSLRDAVEIYQLGKKHQVPWFTSSAYRFYASMQELKKKEVGELRGAISYGPSTTEKHHPDLFWYGIHPSEALFTILGRGCQSVVRTTSADTDVVTGTWSGGRVGTLHGLRNQATPHRVIVFGTQAVVQQEGSGDYAPLVGEIMKFFISGVPPVSPEESIELMAFMEAADESKRQGGKPVSLQDVLKKAGYRAEGVGPEHGL